MFNTFYIFVEPIKYYYYLLSAFYSGYINEAGTLNIERFASYMKKLSKYDMEHFQTAYADLKLFEAKTGRRPGTERKSVSNIDLLYQCIS